MNNEIGEDKKEEIIKACEELYKETSFKDITIKRNWRARKIF